MRRNLQGGLPSPALSGSGDGGRFPVSQTFQPLSPTGDKRPRAEPSPIARGPSGRTPSLALQANIHGTRTPARRHRDPASRVPPAGDDLVVGGPSDHGGGLRQDPGVASRGGKVIDARVVDDGNLVTAGGVTSGIDLALWMITRECGASIAISVESVMEYEQRGVVWRSSGPPSHGNVLAELGVAQRQRAGPERAWPLSEVPDIPESSSRPPPPGAAVSTRQREAPPGRARRQPRPGGRPGDSGGVARPGRTAYVHGAGNPNGLTTALRAFGSGLQRRLRDAAGACRAVASGHRGARGLLGQPCSCCGVRFLGRGGLVREERPVGVVAVAGAVGLGRAGDDKSGAVTQGQDDVA